MLQSIFLFFLLPCCNQVLAANDKVPNTLNTIKEKDIVDLFKRKQQLDSLKKSQNKTSHFSFAPAIGYTLQTGFAGLLSSNYVYTNKNAKPSEIISSIAYTELKQIIFPLHAEIWTRNNKFKIISDNRYMKYPSETFGLGNPRKFTAEQNGYFVDYNYIKFHESVLTRINKNIYAGIGYFADYFWNIKEINPPFGELTSFEKYYNGAIPTTEVSSGFNFQTLIDSRDNSINAKKGFYASLNYRRNLEWMYSDEHWQSIILELKKYITFPTNSKNVLAIWNYNWLTSNEKTPYLLLPSTGWDDFFNTGRGYIQGRYRGKNMTYWEMEYRFRILNNGLLGGVVFGNAQTLSKEILQSHHAVTQFGYGLGMRIRLNKHSDTNLCIDYGWGKSGSRGFFVNLGEVF